MLGTFVSMLVTMLLITFGTIPSLAAQDATPSSAFADLGLPELEVTVTADAYEGIPEQVEAGRYLVSLQIEEGMQFGGGIAFVQPSGMTADEFIGAISGPPDQAGVGSTAGTPVEEAGATPAETDEPMGGLPAFIFDATYAGGIYSFTGAPTHVVLDLTPGEWIAWADDPEAPQQPVIFNVTGEMPTDLPEPESAATIIMGEYVIEVSEGQLTAGSQMVRIDNVGAQPHFVGWFQGPDGMTEDQVAVVLDEEMQAEMTGTPPAWSGLNPDEDLMPIVFTGTQSTGTSIWIPVDLEAGTHGLICFFPDMGDGAPHAYHGMYNVVEVGE